MAFKQRQQHSLVLLYIIFLHISITSSAASSKDDEEALLQFKQGLKDDSGALSSWDPSKTPCFGNKPNWAGLICSRAGNVWGLRLENMKLSGSIDIDALSRLSKLRSISLMNNGFDGPLPDFRKLKALKGLFVSKNEFEGPISPDAFEGMRRLRKVHLSNNKFSGEIPISLVNLQKIIELKLENNKFQGPIPDFKSSANLKLFNVSNNQLQGPVPSSLAKFDPNVFSGNKDLCGPPLGSECAPTLITKAKTPSPSQSASASPLPPPPPAGPALTAPPKASDKAIPLAAIAAGIVVAIILAILLLIIVLKGINRDKNKPSLVPKPSVNAEDKTNRDGPESKNTTKDGGGGGGGGDTATNNKLTFVKKDRLKFDLPDLLKAAAEILGSGSFGSSYKATFNNGDAVVVKRFKLMNHVSREEFQEHMRRLGRLSHPNLLPLVAYYYRKEEKLFITEPIEKGSLAVLLHGQRRGKPTLDWPTRLKVIKGVARGLYYLYKELSCLVAPHGHLKSSNVLLNSSYEPLLSDYALIPLINQEKVQELMVAYKSPEYFNNGRITKKTDVWSLGILIIEILTGKFPTSSLQQGSEVDMTIWVESIINEGFDKNMKNTRNSEGQMQKLLDIGLACCQSNVDKRLDIKEACEKIENVQERDNDNDNDDDFYSTVNSEADVRSSRDMSDDFSVIIN